MTDAYAIEDPSLEAIEPSGEVVYLNQPVEHPLLAAIRTPNLAEELDDSTLTAIGSKVVEEYEVDLGSRKQHKWDERNEAALKLAMQVKEAKSYPWPNAANIKYPLIATAAIQFNARAYPAIVDGYNVVKGKVMGKPDEAKTERSNRVARHMSYQLLEEMDGWEEDMDRLLIMLPIVGTVFKKTWFNPAKGKNDSELVTADKLVVNYWSKPLDASPRITQVSDYYPHEVEERFRDGRWMRIDIGPADTPDNDDSAPHEFLEQHRLWDMDDDGYPEPYVVTVHRETQRVVRIVANYDEEGLKLAPDGEVLSIAPVQYFTKYGFIPSMDGSFYDIGFGSLLDALNETINSTLNQLMDSGHLANAGGGFIGGNVIKGGALTFRPGEWKRVDAAGPDLRAAIVPLPVREPSGVLFSLLGMLIEATKDITATKDILTGETQGQNQPVGTTLASIEQGLKVFTAIFKRVHRALKDELGKLARLNKLYLDDQAYFVFHDEEGVIARADYAAGDCDVVPVSDPTAVTDMQRISRAQFLMQFLGKGLDDKQIITRVLEAASISDVAGLWPDQPQPNPEMVMEQAKLKLEEGKLALEADRNEIEKRKLERAEAEADADIQATAAQTAKTLVETMLLTPAFRLQLAQAFMDAQNTAAQAQADDGATEDEVPAQPGPLQQGEPVGMAGAPVDQAVHGLPEGPAIGPGGAMGEGGEPEFGPAGEGPGSGGIVGPGVG